MIAGIVAGVAIVVEPPISAESWRLYVSAVDGGSFVAIAELEFRSTPDVPEQATGGTPSASSQFDGSTGPEKAFNGTGGDFTNIWASSAGAPQWIAYQYPAPHVCRQVAIRARSDGDTFGQTPSAFDVQYYDDDTASWVTAWSVTGSTGWAGDELRTFTQP